MTKKKFWFSVFAMFCISVVTMAQGFSSDTYLKLVLIVCGVYQTAQTITDIRKGNNGKA